jgi:GTPase
VTRAHDRFIEQLARRQSDRQPSLAERLLEGDRRALARAITLVEDGDPRGYQVVSEIYPHTGRCSVLGITGPPGVGKSTLAGAMIRLERACGRTVAVLSVDPSSPFTTGALLGDRIRLSEHFLDPGVFIRSMASRGALGGLSAATLQAELLMDASGRDLVLLETVGVGQAEVDILDHSDSVILVLTPGYGDSVQALKAGVMEIPDIIVVNKADHPLTDTMVSEIKGVLALAMTPGWQVPVLCTEAAVGEGVSEVLDKVDEHREYLESENALAARRRRTLQSAVMAIVAHRMREALEARVATDESISAVLERVVRRELDPASAAAEILARSGLARFA